MALVVYNFLLGKLIGKINSKIKTFEKLVKKLTFKINLFDRFFDEIVNYTIIVFYTYLHKKSRLYKLFSFFE